MDACSMGPPFSHYHLLGFFDRSKSDGGDLQLLSHSLSRDFRRRIGPQPVPILAGIASADRKRRKSLEPNFKRRAVVLTNGRPTSIPLGSSQNLPDL